MVATYDPLLVTLSVIIAILGSWTGLRLARRLAPKSGTARKALLSGAAISIGCGIWSMHFVGMLALQLPVTIGYDVLLTLISALVAILVTGLGLFMASYGDLTLRKLTVAGLFMGLGISTMHYVGMAAVRANVAHEYAAGLVAASVLIGIGASTLALRLAFTRKNPRQTVAAAVVMGLAISGMHYTAMAAMTFLPAASPVVISAPLLSPQLLAIVVAVAAFLIFGFTLLVALPDGPREQADGDAVTGQPEAKADPAKPAEAPANGRGPSHGAPLFKLPVQKNKTTLFLDLESVVSVRADAHYTRIYDGKETFFCSLSLSELEARLDPERFLRVHRSYIVNLRYARSFERRNEQGLIRLAGRASVPVSRRNVPRLRSALGLHH